MATDSGSAPVVLFGYDSSAFTQKVRYALMLKQIPYTFVTVPSMMPRPLLKDNFNITYRKIPVLAIGKEIYIDTALQIEALEFQFPSSAGYGSLYPPGHAAAYRPLIRGFASYWIDLPFFRVSTGLIPHTVWRSHFGVDRADLIGHKLNPDKLEKKVPSNLSGMDLQLSLLEPLFVPGKKWVFDGEEPSAADVALFFLDWAEQISRGQGVKDLTGGSAPDGGGEGMGSVLNKERYPGIFAWWQRFGAYLAKLPSLETKIQKEDEAGVKDILSKLKATKLEGHIPLLPTPAAPHQELDKRNELVQGADVIIAPDDTGRDSPTKGTLLAITPEEVVIKPREVREGARATVGEVRIHFPRAKYVIRPAGQARL